MDLVPYNVSFRQVYLYNTLTVDFSLLFSMSYGQNKGLFGGQIRLDYGDPQPIALGGRLVAAAEIAPELLTDKTYQQHGEAPSKDEKGKVFSIPLNDDYSESRDKPERRLTALRSASIPAYSHRNQGHLRKGGNRSPAIVFVNGCFPPSWPFEDNCESPFRFGFPRISPNVRFVRDSSFSEHSLTLGMGVANVTILPFRHPFQGPWVKIHRAVLNLNKVL